VNRHRVINATIYASIVLGIAWNLLDALDATYTAILR
jgi:hypothetical protein